MTTTPTPGYCPHGEPFNASDPCPDYVDPTPTPEPYEHTFGPDGFASIAIMPDSTTRIGARRSPNGIVTVGIGTASVHVNARTADALLAAFTKAHRLATS